MPFVPVESDESIDSVTTGRFVPVDDSPAKRTWGEAASDTAMNAAEGSASGITQMIGGAADKIQRAIINPKQRVIDAAREGASSFLSLSPVARAAFDQINKPKAPTEFTPEDVARIQDETKAYDDSYLGSLANTMRDETKMYLNYYKDRRSDAGNAQDAGLGAASKEGALSALGYIKDNPGALGNMIAKSMGYAAPMILAGRLGSKEVGQMTNMGLSGLAGGASSADQTRDSILAMPEAQLIANPQYAALRKAGMDHAGAARYLADTAADKAFNHAALVSAGAAGLTAPLETAMLRKGIVPTGAGLKAEAKALGSTVAKESSEEYIQEGLGEQLGQHLGEYQAGVPKNWLDVAQDVNTSGVLGALAGAGQGTGMHAIGRINASLKKPDQPIPTNPPEINPDPPNNVFPSGTGGSATPQDSFVRLAELETISQQRELTPAEINEAASILRRINQEDVGGSQDLNEGFAVAQHPAFAAPQNQTSTTLLQQTPSVMPMLAPEVLARVQSHNARLEQISAEIPTRSEPVQASLNREAEKIVALRDAEISRAQQQPASLPVTQKEETNGAIPAGSPNAQVATQGAQASSAIVPGSASAMASAPAGVVERIGAGTTVVTSGMQQDVPTGASVDQSLVYQPQGANDGQGQKAEVLGRETDGNAAPSQQKTEKETKSRSRAGLEDRDDLVGAIMRVTGGKGISPKIALDTTGDTANRVTKLRGLFTNAGTEDLGDVAMLLREQEGYDVKDGEHLSELIRQQASGDSVYSMERMTREAEQNAQKQYKEEINRQSPAQFIKAPDGSIDFGEITVEQAAAMKRQAGKIRLQQGVQNSDGTGNGLAHIEANHGAQIRNAGFSSVEEFVAHVATKFNEVLQSEGRQLLVAVDGGRQDVMFVQLEPADSGDYYRINTAFPASRDYLAKQQRNGMKLLWGGSEPASPVAGQQALYAGTPDENSGRGAPIAQGQSSDSSVAAQSAENKDELSSFNDNSVKPYPTKEGAEKMARTLTRKGMPSEAYPHPAEKGMWAIRIPVAKESINDDVKHSKKKSSTSEPTPITRQSAESSIKAALGDKVAQILLDSGIISFENAGSKYQGATFMDGSIVLNLDNLTEETFGGVLAHEGFHSTIRDLIGEATYTQLMSRLETLAKQQGSWAEQAKASVPKDTAAKNVTEEIGAYAISQYMSNGKMPLSVRKWVFDFLSALRTAIIKFKGIPASVKKMAIYSLTPQDLSRLAIAGLKAKAAGLKQSQQREAMAYAKNGDSAKLEEIGAFLNGDPIATLNTSDAPHKGVAVLREWAVGIFRDYGFYANSPDLGKVMMDERSVRDSLGHGKLNPAKAVAFKAVPDIIEHGKIAYSETRNRVDSFYVVGPVVIDGVDDVLTVLIRRDVNTQRMYLHSVISKENLLGDRVPGADTDAVSERSGASREGGIRTVLRDALNIKRQDVRYSISSTAQAAKQKVSDLTSAKAMDTLIYNYQDKYIDLKRIQDRIKSIQGTVSDLNDAYLGEEMYHSRLAKRTEDFLKDEIRPLMALLHNTKTSTEELETYLHARHAPEANAEMAKRNPNQKEIDAGKTKAAGDVKALELQLQHAKAKGLATNSIEASLAKARESLYEWNGAQAFDGTEAERLSLSGMSDAAAATIIASLDPAKKRVLDNMASKVDAINAKTLSELERYGLMSKADLDAWRAAYKYYVPLHRDDAHPDGSRHPIGQGFSVKGSASKSRTGSNAKVTNILGHIAMQREAALTRGEKNHVTKKLYLLAAQNPDPDFWQVVRPPMIETIDRKTGFVRKSIDPNYKNKPNVVMLRIAGKDAVIVFNEHNENAVRLAESIKNLDVSDLDVVLGLTAKATRWFASVNTQYNPVFGMVNFVRDIQAGVINLSSTELKDAKAEVFAESLRMFRDAAKVGFRLDNMSAADKALFEDFQRTGGATGYRDMFATPEDRVKSLQKELKALDRGNVSKAAHSVAEWLSDYNTAMENIVRLSAYKAGLKKGMSKERAASLAKNLTVNFNRKGRKAREIGALYAFFNAAVQGTARMGQTLTSPAGKKIILGGVAIGFINSLIAMMAMGGDDDEYDKIPEFVKESSLIIPLGHDKYAAIPMPLGFNAFPNIGRLFAELLFGGKEKTAGKQSAKMLQALVDAFNPLGGSSNIAQMVSPTVIDPMVALMQNRDWKNKPIYREDRNRLDPTPGHKRTKDSASTPSKYAAEFINWITGGNEYRPGLFSPTPDQLDFVIGQLTGGVGRELMKLEQTVSSKVTGEELPVHKIPLISRFYGTTSGPSGQSEKFYENIKELNELENEKKGRIKDGKDVEKFMSENPMTELIVRGNSADRQVTKLREIRRRIIKDGLPGFKEDAKQYDELIYDAMKRLNHEVKQKNQQR